MQPKSFFVIVFMLAAAGVLAAGVSPVTAQNLPPIETTRLFSSSLPAGSVTYDEINVKFDKTTGLPAEVRIGKNCGCPEEVDDCVTVSPSTEPVFLCFCKIGTPKALCDFSLYPENFDCAKVSNAGPRSSGCPIFANPTYYLQSADVRRR